MESCLQRSVYRFPVREFLLYTGKDDHVCVHGHTDAQDDTGDTRKGQCDVKRIEQHEDQLGIDDQGKAGCKAREQIYKAHKHADNGKSDSPCQKAGADRFLAQLGPYDLRADLFQLQVQSSDTDCGSQILRRLIGLHSRDLSLSVLDRIVNTRHADQFAVIIDRNGFAALRSLFRGGRKSLCSFIIKVQLNRVLSSSRRLIRISSCRGALHLCSGQDNGTVLLKLVDGLRQFITCSL